MTDMFDRFAVNLEMWWVELPRIDRVAAAAQAGFRLAEIWYWPNWDVDALVSACSEHGVRLTQIGGWDFEPRFHDPSNREAFRSGVASALDVAHRLGVERVNLNGPYLAPGEDRAQIRAGVVEALRDVVDLVEPSGASLMVEPMNLRVDHPGYSLPTSADVIEVCERVGSAAVGINWDLYHLQLAEGDLTGHLREGFRHVAYVQVADNPGRHEPGTGEIEFGFVLRELTSLGYLGPIGLECSPLESEAQAIERIDELALALE